MSTLFITLDVKDRGGFPLFTLDGNSGVRLGGSTNVDLVDGVKSPDFSLYEDHPDRQPLTQASPTVVWEVAYSEDEKKLTYDLGRHVACSEGKVRLAIGVKIGHNRAAKGQPRDLAKVTCTFWEPDYVEEYATLEESGSPLNCLVRCDGYTADDEGYVLLPATRFSCVMEVDGRIMKIFVSQQKIYNVNCFSIPLLLRAPLISCQIFPEDPAGPTDLHILNRHLYRTSPAEDEDEPAITVPISMLRKVISIHEKQQRYQDISQNIKKRRRDEQTPDDQKNVKDAIRELVRLKKRRVEDKT
jgi:hypothetical protein